MSLELLLTETSTEMTAFSTGYNHFRIAVPLTFQEVFTHFYFAENKTEQPITQTLLPSYQTILIFNFGAIPFLQPKQSKPIRVEKYLVIGPVKQAFDYTLPPGAEILTVNFKDDAFHRLFRHTDIAEFIPMAPGDGDCFNTLWQELNQINNTYDKVSYLLDFCKPYLSYRNKIAAQLATFNEDSLDPIKAVAANNSQTVRNTQLNQKKQFGYSVKEHNRYQRFFKAVELMQSVASEASTINWLEIVTVCGYYDQSQLIKDFKFYINLTPTKYLRFQQDICNPIS